MDEIIQRVSEVIHKTPKNVIGVLEHISKKIGLKTMGEFMEEVLFDFHSFDIESPIEKLFYIALKAIQKLNGIENADDPIELNQRENPGFFFTGLDITPQKQIGKYRVDFLLTYYLIHSDIGKRAEQITKSIIVECDSQNFHERTEKERRYEKERDRYLIQEGFKTFHFTGNEIIENPYKVAKTALLEIAPHLDINLKWCEKCQSK